MGNILSEVFALNHHCSHEVREFLQAVEQCSIHAQQKGGVMSSRDMGHGRVKPRAWKASAVDRH